MSPAHGQADSASTPPSQMYPNYLPIPETNSTQENARSPTGLTSATSGRRRLFLLFLVALFTLPVLLHLHLPIPPNTSQEALLTSYQPYRHIHNYLDICNCTKYDRELTCCLVTDINRYRYKINECACTCGRGSIAPLEKCAHLPLPSDVPLPAPPAEKCQITFPFFMTEGYGDLMTQTKCTCTATPDTVLTAPSLSLVHAGVDRPGLQACMANKAALKSVCEGGDRAAFGTEEANAFGDCCVEVGGETYGTLTGARRCQPPDDNGKPFFDFYNTNFITGCKMAFWRAPWGFYTRCGCERDPAGERYEKVDEYFQLPGSIDADCIRDCLEEGKESIFCPTGFDSRQLSRDMNVLFGTCCEMQCGGHVALADNQACVIPVVA